MGTGTFDPDITDERAMAESIHEMHPVDVEVLTGLHHGRSYREEFDLDFADENSQSVKIVFPDDVEVDPSWLLGLLAPSFETLGQSLFEKIYSWGNFPDSFDHAYQVVTDHVWIWNNNDFAVEDDFQYVASFNGVSDDMINWGVKGPDDHSEFEQVYSKGSHRDERHEAPVLGTFRVHEDDPEAEEVDALRVVALYSRGMWCFAVHPDEEDNPMPKDWKIETFQAHHYSTEVKILAPVPLKVKRIS